MSSSTFTIATEAQQRRGSSSGLSSPLNPPRSATSLSHPSTNTASSIAGPAHGIDSAAFNQAVQKFNEVLTHLPTVAVVKF
jgi:hypothetical protein